MWYLPVWYCRHTETPRGSQMSSLVSQSSVGSTSGVVTNTLQTLCWPRSSAKKLLFHISALSEPAGSQRMHSTEFNFKFEIWKYRSGFWTVLYVFPCMWCVVETCPQFIPSSYLFLPTTRWSVWERIQRFTPNLVTVFTIKSVDNAKHNKQWHNIWDRQHCWCWWACDELCDWSLHASTCVSACK